MNPVVRLIVLSIIMWILNFIFGLIQIKNFNKNYIEMRKKGRVVIGRKKGHITSGIILLIGIDEIGKVVCTKKMQGISVFAKVKEFHGLEGILLTEIGDVHIKGYDKLTRIAIKDAIKNYETFKGGEEVTENQQITSNKIITDN